MKNEQNTDKPASRLTRGARNLILLGIISVVVACLTSGISLAIYHNSGDIYLDRSRPGFIPEEGDNKDQDPTPEEYTFEKSGKLTVKDVEAYLENLSTDTKALDSYAESFGPDALTDKNLGLTESEEASGSPETPQNTE